MMDKNHKTEDRDKRKEDKKHSQWRDEESGVVYRLSTFSYSESAGGAHIFGEIVLEYPMVEGPTIRLAQSKSSGDPLLAEFDPANSEDTLPASVTLHLREGEHKDLIRDLRHITDRLISVAIEHKCIPCQEIRAVR